MCAVGILTKSIVADYCNYCNRHQEKTMPETVFLFCSRSRGGKKTLPKALHSGFISTASATIN
jgi:hypothetical protein